MRWLLLVLPLACQGRAELKPVFQRFDRVPLSMNVQTDIKTTNGRDSKFKMQLEAVSEVNKAEGETVVFDVAITRIKLEGTIEGRAAAYEWQRGGAGTGTLAAPVKNAIEKGWKMTLAGKKGFSMADAGVAFGDVLPVFNPGVFLGFSTPLPYEAVAVGQRWEANGLVFPFFAGFSIRYAGALDDVRGDVAQISSRLVFGGPELEGASEFAAIVKGTGDASLQYDVKAGRPLRGATSINLVSSQGGLKREVAQIIEFEVKK